MKYPRYLLTDVFTSYVIASSHYWTISYLFSKSAPFAIAHSLTFHRKFLYRKELVFLSKFFNKNKNLTIRYNYANPSNYLKDSIRKFYIEAFKTRLKVKKREIFSRHIGKEVYDFETLKKELFDIKTIKRLVRAFNYKINSTIFKTSNLNNLFDINFLRKERTYTKLKYSRVPQYDIVSGGSAALLGAFLGFLICEKYGFELVDSGDFYFIFMYGVFAIFACRFYLKLLDNSGTYWTPLSLKWLIMVLINIWNLFLNCLKSVSKKL